MTPARRRRILCVLLIVGLPPIVLGGAWRLAGLSALEDDLIYYFPVRAFIGETLRNGQWPLWNPYVGLGTSVAADPQAGLWYPPTLLFAALPAVWAYPVMICLHFALAGAGMYRFLRSVGRRWQAALLGAVAFEFCGYLVGHRAHLTILEAAAWLPWMLFAWQRLALTGRRRYLALAAACLGMQMLVQHIQVTIITLAIVTAYAAALLGRQRRSLLWEYPLGVLIGVSIGAVQLLPTLAAFEGGTRSEPAYYLFVENSYAPTSFFMWLFPFLFGTRTPNFYDQPWWGWSHLCEQATYASIAVLVLAIASIGLLRRDRQVRFWWLLAAGCLLIALGGFTPLSHALFYIPVLRVLRVPARWVLGMDVAVIVLAATVFDAMLGAGERRTLAARWLNLATTRALPALAGVCVMAMLAARVVAPHLPYPKIADDIATAIRPTNPAIWVPLLLMVITVPVLVGLCRGCSARRLVALFAVLVVDLASFAAFVDVDVRQYAGVEELLTPPLARALKTRAGESQGRLWVPRVEADYDRPIEVLWPQTNALHRIPVLNGYGPMWPQANRLLLRFMPWGASQDALDLLYSPRLLRSLGLRWLAARTEQERDLMALAMQQPPAPPLSPVSEPGVRIDVRTNIDIRFPISVPQPGICVVELRMWPLPRCTNRWFLWLADAHNRPISDVRWFEPVDLAAGPRRMRVHFRCGEAADRGYVRIWADPGGRLQVSDVCFGAAGPPRQRADSESYRFVDEIEGGVRLYEMSGLAGVAAQRLRWASRVTAVSNVVEAVDRLRFLPEDVGLPDGVVVENPGGPSASNVAGGSVRLVENEPCRVVGEAEGEGGFMVFSESYDPGWHATVDGVQVPVLRANAVLQGIWVFPGKHRVAFWYRPVHLDAGIWVSVIGIAVAAGVALRDGRRHRPSRTGEKCAATA